MILASPYVEHEGVAGGSYRNIIHMRPIAVRENGSLLRMSQDFADGDANFPQIVNRAPLRVRTANDGMRRFLPIPGDDTRYMEMGQPFVQVGGVWTQVSLGTPSRQGHTLTWNLPSAIFRARHGGHFFDFDIELKNGFVPENSRIAFPVGLTGLTRSGLSIQRNGVTVARLRPFQMIDAANPLAAPRPIGHAFTTRNGQPFLVLTLPSLAGMVRPTIDPTLELQPDATAGLDAGITLRDQNSNFGTSDAFSIGELDITAEGPDRVLIKFDLSSIPVSATIDSATLSLYALLDVSSNARTARWFRQKRAWVEAQATWNIYSTGNSWSTAGGFHADDCEQTDIGSRAFTATETLNEFKDWSLTASAVQGWTSGSFANNGLLGKMDTESNDAYQFALSDNATAANRPKLTVVYTEASGLAYMRAPTSGWCH